MGGGVQDFHLWRAELRRGGDFIDCLAQGCTAEGFDDQVWGVSQSDTSAASYSVTRGLHAPGIVMPHFPHTLTLRMPAPAAA